MKQFQRYVFIGTYAELDGRIFNQVGQYADWDEDAYRDRVKAAPFIPNKYFATCGFTPSEILEYGPCANIDSAPESFKQKHLKARIILHEIREGMMARPEEPLPEPASEGEITEEV